MASAMAPKNRSSTFLDSAVESPFDLLSSDIKSCLFMGTFGLEVAICDLKFIIDQFKDL
jgi:hypothetical protein